MRTHLMQSNNAKGALPMKKTPKSLSLEKFIQGANEDNDSKKSRRRISTEHVLLSATGKVEKRENYAKVLLYLLPEIENDMAKYCSGTKQAIITYLMRRGLDELIKENKVVIYEIS